MRNAAFCSSLKGLFSTAMIHWAVRWKCLTWAARPASAQQLHAGRAVADDADAPAVQRHTVIPSGTVEHAALEAILPLDVGQAGMVQYAGGGDHDIRFILQAALHLEAPAAIFERAANDFLVEANHLVDFVFFCRAFEVVLHFGAGRQHVAPVRIRFERIGIGMRRHVAGEAGIGILAPGAADTRGFFVDGHVAETGAAQLDAAQDAGHARAHHYDTKIALCCLAGHHIALC